MADTRPKARVSSTWMADGRVEVTRVCPVRWVDGTEDDMKGRAITTSDADGVELDRVTIDDNLFICDACNIEILTRPIPIVTEYALCRSCQREWGIEDGAREWTEVEIVDPRGRSR